MMKKNESYVKISTKAYKVIEYMQTKYPEILGIRINKFTKNQIIDFAINEWLKHEVGMNDEYINKVWLEESL